MICPSGSSSVPFCTYTRTSIARYLSWITKWTILLRGYSHFLTKCSFRWTNISTTRPIKLLRYISKLVAILHLYYHSSRTLSTSISWTATTSEKLISTSQQKSKTWLLQKWWINSILLSLIWLDNSPSKPSATPTTWQWTSATFRGCTSSSIHNLKICLEMLRGRCSGHLNRRPNQLIRLTIMLKCSAY